MGWDGLWPCAKFVKNVSIIKLQIACIVEQKGRYENVL